MAGIPSGLGTGAEYGDGVYLSAAARPRFAYEEAH